MPLRALRAINLHVVEALLQQVQRLTRLMCLSLFWHFLDVVWICVFTVVYLLGVM